MTMEELQNAVMEKMYLEYKKGKKRLSQTNFKDLGENDDIYIAIKDLFDKNYIELDAKGTTKGMYFGVNLTANGINSIENPKFNKKQVEKSKKFFNTYSQSVFISKDATHQNNLKILLTGFEEDPVLRYLLLKLKLIDYDFDTWYEGATTLTSSMVGSAKYDLPTNLDEKLSLLYKFLKYHSEGKIDIHHFLMAALYSKGDFDHQIFVFNQQVFDHFYKGIISKLDDMLDDFEESPFGAGNTYIYQLSGNTGVIIGDHNHQDVTNISNFEDLYAKIEELYPDDHEEISGCVQTIENELNNKEMKVTNLKVASSFLRENANDVMPMIAKLVLDKLGITLTKK